MTGNRVFLGKTASLNQPRLAAVLNLIRNVGELLRQATVIAFTMRCKVIGDR
ncbi:hypothetical protein MOV66_32125 [Agrobacterium sp. SHOUNA12C]|nr:MULTISPECIES: hypothetical protein [Rhizobium]MCJ9725514.1 hypothetical protein [Agrobacterium sp. BETTINA12B]MCJ9761323.1 hypothetical protein [Agrobacterium sp. SHOUNA12C]EJK84313.1 hypothetical protein PMI03_02726 [Rhizobium sp. AP16]MDJ1633435.1 hypothetical protein [Rhizobium rhizogenes]NTF46977.1 hypothetical protein [Rhizobium rhizogenes]